LRLSATTGLKNVVGLEILRLRLSATTAQQRRDNGGVSGDIFLG